MCKHNRWYLQKAAKKGMVICQDCSQYVNLCETSAPKTLEEAATQIQYLKTLIQWVAGRP